MRLSVAPLIVLAGVSAALHVGKLPPALPELQRALGISLVQGGFLLSLVQLASMLFGLTVGGLVDRIGLRRSMLTGLTLLTMASMLGGLTRNFDLLLVLRAGEGFGFMLVAMPAPGLLRLLVAPTRLDAVLGWWSSYMPLGVALALLVGPAVIGVLGWPGWWWSLAALSGVMAFWLARVVPHDRTRLGAYPPGAAGSPGRLRSTLSAPGPWLVALCFAVYSSQWFAVIGFLPSIYAAAGIPAGASAVLTALAAGVNIGGNVAAGWLLQRGVRARRLLFIGFALMAVGASTAFAEWPAADGPIGLPPAMRYLAVIAFSMFGGMVPATLFSLAVRLAPGPATVSTTVGFMQQWSAIGQFAAPPLVAWVASRAGGWQWTWVVTGACSLVGAFIAWRIGRLLAARAVVVES